MLVAAVVVAVAVVDVLVRLDRVVVVVAMELLGCECDEEAIVELVVDVARPNMVRVGVGVRFDRSGVAASDCCCRRIFFLEPTIDTIKITKRYKQLYTTFYCYQKKLTFISSKNFILIINNFNQQPIIKIYSRVTSK